MHDVLLQMAEQNDFQAQNAMGSGFHAVASGFGDAQSIPLLTFHSNSAEALFPITRPVSSKHLHKGILHENIQPPSLHKLLLAGSSTASTQSKDHCSRQFAGGKIGALPTGELNDGSVGQGMLFEFLPCSESVVRIVTLPGCNLQDMCIIRHL